MLIDKEGGRHTRHFTLISGYINHNLYNWQAQRRSEMEHKQFAQACEALLISPEFKNIKAAVEFRKPNIWHILDISPIEKWTSRFLAWLLNPQSEHSFGDQFLKSLMEHTLQTEIGRKSELTPLDIMLMDLSTAKVRLEYPLDRRYCDIVAFSPEDSTEQNKGFLCIIENKINAKEGLDQTKNYYEASQKSFPVAKYPHRVYIYLTPDGEPPENENFIPLSYQTILQVIDDLISERQINEAEHFLLQQFQENIKRGIAMDVKTLDLAQAVYDQHRDVFEFIIRNVDRAAQDDYLPPVNSKWDGKTRFFNIGEMKGSGYRWDDCRKYNFICAGGAKRYRNWMEQLNTGDVIYAYVSQK